jgi:hypothetical protein
MSIFIMGTNVATHLGAIQPQTWFALSDFAAQLAPAEKSSIKQELVLSAKLLEKCEPALLKEVR